MKLVLQLVLYLFIAPAIAVGQTVAQVSRVPGDGIPDIYYYLQTGFMDIDTDGVDMVAFFIGGADVSTVGCSLCDGMNSVSYTHLTLPTTPYV